MTSGSDPVPGAAQTVLLAPVSEADLVVRAFTAAHPGTRHPGGPGGRYDPYAHVTVLAPFVPRRAVDQAILDGVADAVSGMMPIAATFGQVDRFPNGLVWLAPEDPEPFRELIEAVMAAFPEYPPYGGAYDDVVPHLSLGYCDSDAPLPALIAPIEQMLPARTYVGHLDLVEARTDGRIDLLGRIRPA